MMNLSSNWSNLLKAVALPVGGLAFSYVVVIDQPLRQKIGDLKAKHARLLASVERGSTEQAANLKQLADIERSLRESTALVTTSTTSRADDAASHAAPSSSDQDSLLTELSSTLAMFSRHELTCLASQVETPLSETEKPARHADKATASNSRSAAGQQDASRRANLQLTLRGRFANMVSAMGEFEAAHSRFMVESLEMEPASADDPSHRWILILGIRK